LESIGRLAGGVAHDFNNLLTVINGYAEIAVADLRVDDPLKPDIQRILDAGQQAAALTRQLLAFSREQMLEPRVLDLNEIVGHLETMLRRLIGEHIEFSTWLADGLRRPVPDRAGTDEPGHQRPGRNARGRPAHH
jgi:signal transduction histidine kinase